MLHCVAALCCSCVAAQAVAGSDCSSAGNSVCCGGAPLPCCSCCCCTHAPPPPRAMVLLPVMTGMTPPINPPTATLAMGWGDICGLCNRWFIKLLLQCVTVLQCVAILQDIYGLCNMRFEVRLQRVALCCGVLQRVAACCNIGRHLWVLSCCPCTAVW